MLALDKKRFAKSMSAGKIASVLDLSRRTGLHRNTINHYLAGLSVYQQGYLTLCRELDVNPHDFVCENRRPVIPLAVSQVIDQLTHDFSQFVFVLFGSQARGTAKAFSDWDVGIYAAKGILHDDYLSLLVRADDLCEDKNILIDVVNLNQAGESFLLNNAKNFMYLAGSLVEWHHFSDKLCAINNSKNP